MKFFVLVTLISLTLNTAQASPFEMNDISVLLPLPLKSVDSSLLTPETEGAAGPLIPPNLLEVISGTIANPDHIYVVAIRIDPCFSSKCKAQIRFVWQPLVLVNGKITTVDMGVHTFYEISQLELKSLLIEIKKLKTSYQNLQKLPLGVHPIIRKEGFKGPYWTNFRKMILSLTGAHRLSRLTVMSATVPRLFWIFRGFDIKVDGSAQDIEIKHINQSIEDFSNFYEKRQGFSGGLAPKSDAEDNLNLLLYDSLQFSKSSGSDIQKSLDAAYRMENPRFHDPDTIDCASCHLAKPARAWAFRNFPDLNFKDNPYQFKSSLNLKDVSGNKDSTIVLRNFGYFDSDVAISQRVINESALIVEKLNSL